MQPIATPVTTVLVVCLLLGLSGCSNKEREEGRKKLTQQAAQQIQAAEQKVNEYDFEAARKLLYELREEVQESPYPDAVRYDKLIADIDTAYAVISDKESDFHRKKLQGWSIVDGRLVSRADRQRALAQKKRREEQEGKKKEEERRVAKAEADARARAQAAAAAKAEEERAAQLAERTRTQFKIPAWMELKAVIDNAGSGKIMWDLMFLSPNEYPARSLKDAVRAIESDTYGGGLFNPEDHIKALRRYKKQAMALVADVKFWGKSETVYLPDEQGSAPLRFALKDGKECLLVVGLASDTVYNTIQLSAKQRASRHMQTHVLPALKSFDRALFDTQLDYFGLNCFYGSKDFVNDLLTHAEAMCFVVTRQDCHQFVAGSISQEQLLRRSLVYLSDSNAVFSFTRIELKIE